MRYSALVTTDDDIIRSMCRRFPINLISLSSGITLIQVQSSLVCDKLSARRANKVRGIMVDIVGNI